MEGKEVSGELTISSEKSGASEEKDKLEVERDGVGSD